MDPLDRWFRAAASTGVDPAAMVASVNVAPRSHRFGHTREIIAGSYMFPSTDRQAPPFPKRITDRASARQRTSSLLMTPPKTYCNAGRRGCRAISKEAQRKNTTRTVFVATYTLLVAQDFSSTAGDFTGSYSKLTSALLGPTSGSIKQTRGPLARGTRE